MSKIKLRIYNIVNKECAELEDIISELKINQDDKDSIYDRTTVIRNWLSDLTRDEEAKYDR